MQSLILYSLLALVGLVAPTAAQSQELDDLGLPPLPEVTPDSPRDNLIYADRLPLPEQQSIAAAATLVQETIPASYTGTGFKEIIVYQLPDGYDSEGPPHPLILAYHGYGGSAGSSSNMSTVDEEANARNWIYLSVTGLDDQLFGSPISQVNTEAAIRWMTEQFNVDEDRIYMSGFSVGGGISASFAARHRDPNGIMIAGIGLVSSTFDWAQEYNLGPPELKTWMENPFNFGGPPSTNVFNYQAVSGVYQDEASYPPTPGVNVPIMSMGRNLTNMPIYMTYDLLDFILHVPHINDDFESLITGLGGAVVKDVVIGTEVENPPGDPIPAPHSWFVLDEVAMFDFLETKTADRYPEDFEVMQDVSTRVSWATMISRDLDEFIRLTGDATPSLNRVEISGVENCSLVTLHMDDAGVTGFPVRVTATSADAFGFKLRITGLPSTPTYLTQFTGGALVTGVDSDPATGSLIVDVAGNSTLDVRVRTDPAWTSTLTTSPNPVAIGNNVDVTIDTPGGEPLAYLIVSLTEQLVPVGAVTLTALPLPPALLMLVPLDGAGDAVMTLPVPDDPVIQGLRFPTQIVSVTAPGGDFVSVSNLWGLYTE